MKSSRFIFALGALLICAGAGWLFYNGKRGAQATVEKAASSATTVPPVGAKGLRLLPGDAVEPFYVGLSSLDVEENERAARLYESLSKQLPDEPSIWANLGLARLRLGDVPGAEQALGEAAKLSPQDGAIVVLQAAVDENQGDFSRAVERLQKLPNPDLRVLARWADLLARSGAEGGLRQQKQVLDRLLEKAPGNPVVIFNRARLLARMENAAELSQSLTAVKKPIVSWSAAEDRQLEAVRSAAAAKNFRSAATQLAFLQNQLTSAPDYQAALAELGLNGGSIGSPLRNLQKYCEPNPAVAPPDEGLTFASVPSGTKPDESLFERNAVCLADLNGDFLQDEATATRGGLTLRLQDRQGHFSTFTPPEALRGFFTATASGVWAIDFDADGDLDLVVGREGKAPDLLRNNGDGSFTALETFAKFPAVRELCWVDLDNDGDNDLAFLDGDGRVLVSWNDRAGSFSIPGVVSTEKTIALTYGDIAATGHLDLVAVQGGGAVKRFVFDLTLHSWAQSELAHVDEKLELAAASTARRAGVFLADLDNNGAADLVVTANQGTRIFLGAGEAHFSALVTPQKINVLSIADVDGDGLLDLVGSIDDKPAVLHGQSPKRYHWQALQTRTLAANADSRVNSFGIGGRIEVRAGPLLASAPITSPITHLGLGTQPRAGVARIVWPNGVSQVEFELAGDKQVVAVQRLKGSCPWVFTRVGNTFRFVKDFIWRSPLGMRINSQDTAGVDQTTDWILIPGDCLPAENSAYELRITAELWETHFFDHVSLRAVDHPAEIRTLVDERFVPAHPPALGVVAMTQLAPLTEMRDQAGRDQSAALAASDDIYVNDFPLGQYQGIAQDHWVEFQLPSSAPLDQPLAIVGEGWIYPTDSSINVAISQGQIAAPHDLSLEEFDETSGWRTVQSGLGFPAGKNKTVVLALPKESLVKGHRRFRLRTNLEIYWNQLSWAVLLPQAKLQTTTCDTLSTELRYRGYTVLPAPVRRMPDIPQYDQVTGREARWRDLEGFYTRFGDVKELLAQIDDRYVIMNAGDEMILRFAAPPPPPPGWVRDFVLVGDGWVKDGDFNTANSETVLPLPSHDQKHYGQARVDLATDPVFQRHPEDWQRFHTRYVTPAGFAEGLMKHSPVAEAVSSTRYP